MSEPGPSKADLLLPIADDELILGWRNSEWTGIAPFLEEDVAFSSIAQNEIGHARALYQLVAEDTGGDADSLAFDRGEYRCAPLVELQLVDDWAATVARHFLYEIADSFRVNLLKQMDDPAVAGLAAKIEREEAYHRIHAQMWADRLLADPEGRPRFKSALEELWRYALGVLEPEWNPRYVEYVQEYLGFELPDSAPIGRDSHRDELAELVREMTSVRRSVPGAAW